LRGAFLEHYAEDGEFGRALEDFYTNCGAPLRGFLAQRPAVWDVQELAEGRAPLAAWAALYLSQLERVARRYGLARLGPITGDVVVRPSTGVDQIHDWCNRRAEEAATSGRVLPPTAFNAISFVGRADIDTVRRVTFEGTWDPQREAPGDALRRLRQEADQQLRRQLDAIAQEAESFGFIFLDLDTAARDLTWLFWKTRFRLSYSKIAQRTYGDHPDWLPLQRRIRSPGQGR